MSDATCDSKIRALQAQIAELDRRIEAARKDQHDATLLNTQAIVELQKQVSQVLEAVKKIQAGQK